MPSTSTDRLNGLTTSVAVKPPCRVATTANISLTGLKTVDGVVLEEGDRVLVKDKNDEADNGIYVVSTSAWSRAPDFDGTLDAVNGTLVIVRSGTVNAGTVWELTTEDPVVIGTDDLTFEPALLIDSATAAFLQAGTGAVARTAQDKMRERISVPDFSTLAATLTARGSDGTRLVVPSGTDIAITANTIVPKNITLEVHEGAMITVDSGITFTVRGQIVAANYEIFDGAGTVSLDSSASEYNLAWFKTTNGYINERWDFAKRGMATFRTKVVRWPRPRIGQAGVLSSSGRLFWEFSDSCIFADAQNASVHYVEAEFSAANDCDSFMLFDDASKPENIYFYGPIQAIASATQNVPVGIDFRAASRVSFFGQVVLNGFKTPVKMGGTSQSGTVEDIYMPRTQFAFFSVAALDIYGKAVHTVQNIQIGNLRATAAQVAGLPVVRMRGLLRDINIDNIYYATDVAKDGYVANDAEDVVSIQSNAEGDIRHVEIGGIFQANANNGLKVRSSTLSASDIGDVTVRRIFSKFNGSAADIDYCQRVRILGVENTGDVTIGSNAAFCEVSAAGGGIRTVTNTSTSSIVNGVGRQFSGGGSAPSAAVAWPLHSLVREAGDNRVYMRVGTAGVAADFIMVRGALKGVTGSRPTLAATDVGQMYMDTTLDADGKPIWWTGTAWVDATGLVV